MISVLWAAVKASGVGKLLLSGPTLAVVAVSIALVVGWSAGKNGEAARGAVRTEKARADAAQSDLNIANRALEQERADAAAQDAENQKLAEKVRTYEATLEKGACVLGPAGARRLRDIGR